MPSDIKKAVLALIISCISTLVSVHFYGLEFENIIYNDPLTFGINIVWALIIVWMILDLFKGKDIKLTLVLVGIVYLASLAYDFIAFGFGTSQVFYSVELLMFIFAYFFVRSEESRTWYSAKDL